MYEIDGIWYARKADAPDLGSLACSEAHGPNNMIRFYEGLQADFSKLPKYDRAGITHLSLMTGSKCLMYDSGNIYGYTASNKTWTLIP